MTDLRAADVARCGTIDYDMAREHIGQSDERSVGALSAELLSSRAKCRPDGEPPRPTRSDTAVGRAIAEGDAMASRARGIVRRSASARA